MASVGDYSLARACSLTCIVMTKPHPLCRATNRYAALLWTLFFFFATNAAFATMYQNKQFLFWHVVYKQKDSSGTSTSLSKTSYKMKIPIPRPIETQMREQKCSLLWHYFPWLCLLPVAISGPDIWTVLVGKKCDQQWKLHRDITQAISTLLGIILGYVIQFYSTL